MVTRLANEPAVEVGVGAGQSSWLPSSESWYNDPSRWRVFLAQSGPADWPRVPIGDASPPKVPVAKTVVTQVHETDNTVSFHVSKIGTPVLVKVSYFPNWQASGATGPYRVTPNLMVVVPTAHDVVLHYGSTPADRVGEVLTISACSASSPWPSGAGWAIAGGATAGAETGARIEPSVRRPLRLSWS